MSKTSVDGASECRSLQMFLAANPAMATHIAAINCTKNIRITLTTMEPVYKLSEGSRVKPKTILYMILANRTITAATTPYTSIFAERIVEEGTIGELRLKDRIVLPA
jgi:hypothetical protein